MHPSLFDFDSGNPSKWQAMLSLKKSNIKRLMPLGMRCVCFTFWADSWHHFWWPTSLSWRGPHVYWSWLDVKGYEGLPSARCLAKLPSATQESTYLEAMIVYTESYFFQNRGEMSPRECTSSKPSCTTVGYMFMSFFRPYMAPIQTNSGKHCRWSFGPFRCKLAVKSLFVSRIVLRHFGTPTST